MRATAAELVASRPAHRPSRSGKATSRPSCSSRTALSIRFSISPGHSIRHPSAWVVAGFRWADLASDSNSLPRHCRGDAAGAAAPPPQSRAGRASSRPGDRQVIRVRPLQRFGESLVRFHRFLHGPQGRIHFARATSAGWPGFSEPCNSQARSPAIFPRALRLSRRSAHLPPIPQASRLPHPTSIAARVLWAR